MSYDIICPYCGYDFDEDRPDLDCPTEAYLIKNKIPVPESPGHIFAGAAEYWDQPATEVKVTCYRCNKEFMACRHFNYSVKKIEEEKNENWGY